MVCHGVKCEMMSPDNLLIVQLYRPAVPSSCTQYAVNILIVYLWLPFVKFLLCKVIKIRSIEHHHADLLIHKSAAHIHINDQLPKMASPVTTLYCHNPIVSTCPVSTSTCQFEILTTPWEMEYFTSKMFPSRTDSSETDKMDVKNNEDHNKK